MVIKDVTENGATVVMVYEINLNVVAYEYFNASRQEVEKLHHQLQYLLQYQHSVLEFSGTNL
jgi:hypothetical protein